MKKNIKGLLVAVIVSVWAVYLDEFFLIGAVTLAIILGIFIGNIVKFDETYDHGLSYAEKTLLGYAIAFMGINLDFNILSSLGLKTIVIIVLGMVVTIYSAVLIGKYYKIDTKFALLLGVGNGVCGSSAISAVSPIVKADKNHIGISVAIVNLLGTFGIFLLPFVAFTLGFDEVDAGILVGNTLQAVGQVTAGGFSISDTAGISATTVKMGRVLLLTPLVLLLLYIFHAKSDNKTTKGLQIPLFILFFIFFSLVGSFGLVNSDVKYMIASLSEILLIIAMSAVGLRIHFKSIKSEGKVALKIAIIVFMIQILFTVGLLGIL